jgi:fused signal recognition particle receptor
MAAELLAWVITHPVASILGMIAVPVAVVCVDALRRRRGARQISAASAKPPGPKLPGTSSQAQALRPELATTLDAAADATTVEPYVALRDRLSQTRESLVGRLAGLLGSRQVDALLLEELEGLLLTADLGVATVESLLETVRERSRGFDAEAVRGILRDAILAKLEKVEVGEEPSADGLQVILVLGVNGSGKTTTVGKLAARHARAGKKVLLGAGDTFRAAASEQLQVWGERAGCAVIAGQAGGDPTSVAFDTVKAARARGMDVAIIDTAGRLQTRKPLMEELAKMSRVLGREIPGAPHQTLLVLDANTGQNAISQARLFSEVTTVTGLVLTKLDGTAKGGVIVGLADEFGIPVRYVGVGEAIEDLREFNARDFVDALFGQDAHD